MSDSTDMTDAELDTLLGGSGEQSRNLPDWAMPAVTAMIGLVTGKMPGGALGEGAGNAMGNAVEDLLGGAGGRGALQGLVDRCNQSGLEDKVRSWLSSGENQPLQPDEIERMLGGEKIEAMAQEAGQSPDDVKAALAQALPHVVNVLTPEGKIPDDTHLAVLGDRLADPGQTRDR